MYLDWIRLCGQENTTSSKKIVLGTVRNLWIALRVDSDSNSEWQEVELGPGS